jgi:hypothetical protein
MGCRTMIWTDKACTNAACCIKLSKQTIVKREIAYMGFPKVMRLRNVISWLLLCLGDHQRMDARTTCHGMMTFCQVGRR